jgi:hypothetical protein
MGLKALLNLVVTFIGIGHQPAAKRYHFPLGLGLNSGYLKQPNQLSAQGESNLFYRIRL